MKKISQKIRRKERIDTNKGAREGREGKGHDKRKGNILDRKAERGERKQHLVFVIAKLHPPLCSTTATGLTVIHLKL